MYVCIWSSILCKWAEMDPRKVADVEVVMVHLLLDDVADLALAIVLPWHVIFFNK